MSRSVPPLRQADTQTGNNWPTLPTPIRDACIAFGGEEFSKGRFADHTFEILKRGYPFMWLKQRHAELGKEVGRSPVGRLCDVHHGGKIGIPWLIWKFTWLAAAPEHRETPISVELHDA